MTGRALVIVDVQNDFCEGGSLAVAGGADVARRITRYLHDAGQDYDLVVATRDWHEDPGAHFSDTPDFQESWPVHCVAGTGGAEFHPDFDTSAVDVVVSKGRHAAAYSGFEGTDAAGAGLEAVLGAHDVRRLDVCGLATDYCVKATALDGAKSGFDVRVLRDLCAGVAPGTSTAALAELEHAGVELTP